MRSNFLGMIFDSKLTWAKHIDDLKLKVKKSLNLLKVTLGLIRVQTKNLCFGYMMRCVGQSWTMGVRFTPQQVKATLMHLTLSTIWDYVIVLGLFELLLKVCMCYTSTSTGSTT